MEEQHDERDPLRAPAEKLRGGICAAARSAGIKLKKAERELLAFLELHPGSHNLRRVARNGEERKLGGRLACAN